MSEVQGGSTVQGKKSAVFGGKTAVYSSEKASPEIKDTHRHAGVTYRKTPPRRTLHTNDDAKRHLEARPIRGRHCGSEEGSYVRRVDFYTTQL